MFDTVIRGATIIDGSGKAGFTADVAVADDAGPEPERVESVAFR